MGSSPAFAGQLDRLRRSSGFRCWLGLVLLSLAVGCGSGDQAVSAGAPGQVAPAEVSTTVSGSGAASDPSVAMDEAVVALRLVTVRRLLPVDGQQFDCVVQRVRADAELSGRVQRGLERSSSAFGDVVEVAEACVRSVTFAPQFVELVEETNGPLSGEQVECLSMAYGDLSQGELEQLLAAGLDPLAEGAARGQEIMSDLLGACGVD